MRFPRSGVSPNHRRAGSRTGGLPIERRAMAVVMIFPTIEPHYVAYTGTVNGAA
jgi:hypothetical protein